jgi:hypothetical protein
MSRARIVLVSVVITIVSLLIVFGIMALFYKSSQWKTSLIVAVASSAFTGISSYRTLLRAFNYDIKN